MNISIVQGLINSIEKPAIFIDTDYKILAVNEAYQQTYEAKVNLGKSRCFEISHGHDAPCDKYGEDCPIQACISTGRASGVVHIHNTEFGRTYCDILMKPIKDETGMTTGFLEILDKINFASAESRSNRMIGSSSAFKSMLTNINRAAQADIAVLLHGETGTGKELVAKALHDSSKRSKKPFVVIECTGLNENLFESELFGHEKGAFTGAHQNKKGLIEVAHGGTVFFDEIADVTLSMQVKLLRLLETQCYRKVGSTKEIKADFRLICASHKNLMDLVEKGLFRKDLYYRIAGFPITLPSLAQRQDDIPALAKHFLKTGEMRHKSFTEQALLKLSEYAFPGNIRELRNIVEHSALLANEDIIEEQDLPPQVFSSTRPEAAQSMFNSELNILPFEEIEKQYLSEICKSSTQSIDEISKQLGVSARTLYRKLQKYQIHYDH